MPYGTAPRPRPYPNRIPASRRGPAALVLDTRLTTRYVPTRASRVMSQTRERPSLPEELSLRAGVDALQGVRVSAVSVQRVSLEHAYLEIIQGGTGTDSAER